MTFFWIILIAVVVIGIVILVVALTRRPGEPLADNYQEALRALLDGRETEAIKRLRDTVMKDTDNVDAYIRLGRLIRERGDAEKAANIHQSLTVRPALKRSEELLIYEELVEDYLAMGRVEKTIGLLKELIRLSSDKLPQLRRLLAMLFSRNRTDEAAETLSNYKKIFSDKKEGAAWYAELARLRWAKGDEEKAQDAIRQAQRLAKNHPYVFIVQIKHLVDSDQKSKARSLIEKFIKLYPEYAEKVLDLAEQVYFDLGAYEKVVPLYEGLLERFPDKYEIRLRLARLKAKAGEHDAALELINEVLVKCPGDVRLLLERTRLLLDQEKWKAAKESFDKLAGELILMPAICASCGHQLDATAWFCPSCGAEVSE
jgi:lipopolysaccharide biosynthesis regulator YciM